MIFMLKPILTETSPKLNKRDILKLNRLLGIINEWKAAENSHYFLSYTKKDSIKNTLLYYITPSLAPSQPPIS